MHIIENKVFENIDFDDQVFENYEVKNCVFVHCTFNSIELSNTRLGANTWKHCTVNNPHLTFSEMTHSVFENCNLININWSEVQSNMRYRRSIHKIKDSYLKYNIFILLDLQNMDFRSNVIHHGLFEECDLHTSNFSGCDLLDTEFIQCNLMKANFKDASGYYLDIKTCQLKDAKVSLFEAVNLALQLGIEVD